MTSYEKLLQRASEENIRVYESIDLNGDANPVQRLEGLYIDGNVALDKELKTTKEKSCVLAEELGHHYTTVGDILSVNNVNNRKQELRARLWAYNCQIGLAGLVSAARAGCRNGYETAEYLDVTEEFLQEAIECYRSKYGTGRLVDNYWIMFEPYLQVYEYKV